MVAVRLEQDGDKLLFVVKPHQKIQLLAFSTPMLLQHQSIIATVYFIMPSPFLLIEDVLSR